MTEDSANRDAYYYFHTISTRWTDNDIYGHVNNSTYYSYFDTAANQYLIDHGGLDIQNAEIVGFVVASNCIYLAPIAHPDRIEAGFRVNRIGSSSVEYGIGIFRQGESRAAAHGTFTHVFVNRKTNRSTAIPKPIRYALEAAVMVV